MNVVDAYNLLKVDKSKFKIDQIAMTKSFFVFSIVPKDYDGDKNDYPLIPSKSVNKNTGEIDIFNPITVSDEELDSMVTIYKYTNVRR